MQTTPIRQTGTTCRWRYEMSLFRNPNTFLLVAKVLFGTILGMAVLIMLPIALSSNGFKAETFLEWSKTVGIICALFAILLVLGYLLYAAVMGGKYIVDFTMDDNGFVHAQSPAQAKKAQKLGQVTAAAGALSGRPGAVGTGMMATRTVSTTEWSRVKKVIANKRTSVIKVHGGGANELYADGDDFEFVKAFVRARIPAGAKWKEK